MFEHSIRVPRHFKVAANIFKKVSTEGGSVKTLLYDDKLKHFRTNVLYALITETIKHAAEIDKIFKCSGFLEAESRFDPWLAKVLTTEILFGKKVLPGKSKPEQTILSYKDKFQTYIVENDGDLKSKVRRPRYVRVNTNLLTTSDAIRAFQDEGYKFIRCTSGSYDDYLQQIQNLTEYDFTQDYHVKTVFVFFSGTKFHEHELYLENKIILQDKATALAVHLLAPPPCSVVLDLCAAPGMKTTQLAAYLRNQGKVYAIERNEQRYETLCEFVERTDSKCVQTVLKDSLEIKRGDFDDVEYILLDPSCSGSGMEFSIHNYFEDTRLAKLTSLQEKFLKHAMNAFPNVKRIVYSTCSLFPEENERVITNVVKMSRAKWRVQDVKELLKGQWNNFGSGMYGSMGTRCLYAKPDTDFTTGFFLAVLDKDQKDKSHCVDNEAGKEDKSNSLNKGDEYCKAEISSLTEVENQRECDVRKKSKKRDQESDNNSDAVADETFSNGLSAGSETKTKNSKKRKKLKGVSDQLDNHTKNNPDEDINALEHILDEDQDMSQPKKKKKKRDKNSDVKVNCNDNTNLDELTTTHKSKHKKKDKNYDNDLDELTATGKSKNKKKDENYSKFIDEPIAIEKSKHKKKDENYDNDLDELTATGKSKNKKKDENYSNFIDEAIAIEKSKHKKKDENYDNDIDELTATGKSKNKKKDENYSNFIDEPIATEKSKHKKKDKKFSNEIEETIDDTEIFTESTKKRKNLRTITNTADIEYSKKKYNNYKNAEEDIFDEIETPKKSKKKKKRKHSETECNTKEVENDTSVEEVRKKSKKKRSKEMLIEK